MVILNMEPITEWLTQWIIVGCIGLGLVAVGLMVLMCSGILSEFVEWMFNISLCMMAVGVVVGLIGLLGGESTKVETGRYKYEISLEEGHSVEELTEKYVVKKQNGLIFVIEDRKEN